MLDTFNVPQILFYSECEYTRYQQIQCDDALREIYNTLQMYHADPQFT